MQTARIPTSRLLSNCIVRLKSFNDTRIVLADQGREPVSMLVFNLTVDTIVGPMIERHKQGKVSLT